MPRRLAAVPFALCILVAGAPASADPRFDVIEPLPGKTGSEALDVSEDGCLVVGHSEYEALRWQGGVTSPLREPPDPNPSIAYAMTPDGRVVVGADYGVRSPFRFQDPDYDLLDVPGSGGHPEEARAVSADGGSVGGCVHAAQNGVHCDWPFYWRNGVGELLNGLSGQVEYGSVQAISSDGEIAAGTAGGKALIWRPGEDTVQELPTPGYGAVRGLSPDGAVAVGSMTPLGQTRAFRWTAATGMVDLGPETHVAHAVSADGKRIVGEGPNGAFIWDALHGARPLADVLRDEYGLDLAGFDLGSPTAISPDGKTIVGNGGGANGPRGWRARLREEPCLPEMRIDSVLVDPDLTPPLGRIEAIASDAPERVYVSAGYGHFLRVDVGEDGSASAPVPLPDLFDGSNPMFLRAGPDAIYAGGGHPRLVRIVADGTASTVFDASTWPPLPPPSEQMPTFPADAAIAPDGTLFVAAYARLVRIDPDGSAHELIDAPHASAAMGLGSAGIWHVAWAANGRLFLLFENEGVLILDAATGAVLSARRDIDGAQALAADPDGGFWLYGNRLAHYTATGARNRFFDSGEIPDGAGGTAWSADSLVVDERSDAYYFGYEVADGHPFIARIDAEGVAEQIIGWGQPPGFYSFFRVDALHTSHRRLYFANGPSVLRIGLPPLTACRNGLDDDGDGAADYPADRGCISREDDGERSFEQPCDNGIDDDRDGVSDFPADPGCVSLVAARETTECDDGLDNDGDGAVDWDGIAGDPYSGIPNAPPDPECAGDPRRVIEHPWSCGLGFEVALVALPLVRVARALRRRARGAK